MRDFNYHSRSYKLPAAVDEHDAVRREFAPAGKKYVSGSNEKKLAFPERYVAEWNSNRCLRGAILAWPSPSGRLRLELDDGSSAELLNRGFNLMLTEL